MSAEEVSTSARVAAALREMSALIALDPEGRFRARAYERAASVVAALPDLESIVSEGKLTTLPGIGRSLASVIEEIVRTGASGLLERLRAQYPPGTAELSKLLSIERVRAVHEALGVTTIAELKSACESGELRRVAGFGEKSERRLLEKIEISASEPLGVLLPEALLQAGAFRDHLRVDEAVGGVEIAGALRRRLEVIDRIELVVASSDASAVRERARSAPGIVALTGGDPARFIVRRAGGLEVHVRVVQPSDFAVAWTHETGSEAHVKKLIRIAGARGLTLDDHRLRRGVRRVRVATERELYDALGLDFVEPEMREDAGELESAAAHELPADLVQLSDILGATHCHTVYSDGKHTIAEMARAAEELGFRYLTITDHSASATYARGLDVDRLRQQADEIDRVQEETSVKLLHGTESDILQDGSLDFPDVVLERLDVVIASIHQRYRLNEAQMTERLLRAIGHPIFKIWGHPLGRYVLTRPPIACRMDDVLDAIASSRAAIEVNGDPHRLDLEPRWIREAARRGIRFVVSSDAHSTSGLANVRWGVDMARRGGLRRGDVLNTLDAAAFARAVRPGR